VQQGSPVDRLPVESRPSPSDVLGLPARLVAGRDGPPRVASPCRTDQVPHRSRVAPDPTAPTRATQEGSDVPQPSETYDFRPAGSAAPSPVADPTAMIVGDRYRITVLTAGLVRLEWSDTGTFEDRASTLARHRDLPVPAFQVTESDAALEVVTDRFHLTYDRGPFTSAGLSLQVRGNTTTYHSVWRYGRPVPDLRGTARTLDNVDGRLPLEPGVVSRRGFAALDDSDSMLFTDDGWVVPRPAAHLDLYVFAYGLDHTEAVQAFYALSGPQPVLPRWALGNWWSRYHPYTADEYLALHDRFEAEDLPFSVAVIDMDWHRVDDVPERYGSGWTGYSWNRRLIPDPEGFLAELHRRGLRVTLNVHPADGVRAFEDAYPAMAAALDRDTADEAPIPFDVTDPDFVAAYFEILHRGLEKQGVDFWWLDWQSGPYSRVPGIDPLWMLNHFHYLDAARSGQRPLTFSRYAGPGSHRYPVGFSGDTVISWASLDFQPEFTATAANIGYGWWSHDIGGHFQGTHDPELLLRWVQLGVFSPILRLHSARNPFVVKEPWAYGGDVRTALGEALRLRHRLVPYLHTMNHRAATDGVPLVRPMYHLYPTQDAAYGVPNQFGFGSELIVAPITTPTDEVTRVGSVRAWLPAGVWVDLFTGVSYDGDREVLLHRDGRSIPVLVRAGGIVPLAAPGQRDAAVTPEALEVMVAPGADGRFALVEDDGAGADPATIRSATTRIDWDQATGTLTVHPVAGAAEVVPQLRSWSVTVLGVVDPGHVRSDGASVAVVIGGVGSTVEIADVPTDRAVEVVFGPGLTPTTSDVRGRLFQLLMAAHHGLDEKADLWRRLDGAAPASVLTELAARGVPAALQAAIGELLTARI
jgi:alpha-glucosidase (family GH31 glycosyl hydrolase)